MEKDSTQLENIVQLIRQSGLKATQQRIVIFHVLFQDRSHPSSEDIFSYVKKTNPSISLATVYNTLEVFVKVGIARKIPNPDGIMRYESEINPHNHIYLKDSHEIIDFHDENLQILIKKYLDKKQIENLRINNFSLLIEGEKVNSDREIKIN